MGTLLGTPFKNPLFVRVFAEREALELQIIDYHKNRISLKYNILRKSNIFMITYNFL